LNASDRYQSVMELLSDLGFDPAKDKIDPASMSLSEYPEFTSKMNAEPYDVDAEDNTMIRSEINRRKEYDWLYIVLPLLVSGLLSFILFGNPSSDELAGKAPEVSIHQDSVNNQVVPPESNQPDSQKQITQSNPILESAAKSVDTKQENYQKLFNEAVVAYNQNNFDRSLELINQAESYIKTPDTEKYKTLIEQEKEKIDIQNRKNLYEVWMKFGNFVVVRKKSNELVGAIDERGLEKIPCKYVGTEPAGVNRLFQKENNLYDLYDSNGVLIKENTNGLE